MNITIGLRMPTTSRNGYTELPSKCAVPCSFCHNGIAARHSGKKSLRAVSCEPFVHRYCCVLSACMSGGSSDGQGSAGDRKSTRLNSSHVEISYAVFCLKKKKKTET